MKQDRKNDGVCISLRSWRLCEKTVFGQGSDCPKVLEESLISVMFGMTSLGHSVKNNRVRLIFRILARKTMTENELSRVIVDTCYRIHMKLGPGLLESVYEEILYYELVQKGFKVARQEPIPVVWEQVRMKVSFRADLIVENKVLIEIKSVQGISPVFSKTVLTYLNLSKLKLGLLVNFNEYYIKNGITRIVNNL